MRSFLLFWPKHSNTKLRALFDSEITSTSEYGIARDIITTFNVSHGFDIYISLNEPSNFYSKGYDRQQLLMFWADNYTTAEYVGFVDTDCLFITYVDISDVFEDGLPVINGRIGYNNRKPWSQVPGATYAITGHEEPMRCMSYFPVIIKTKHLKEIREFISDHNGRRPFNEVFREFADRAFYSQFNLMCTYLWSFRRDEYRWYVHDETPEWDGFNPKPVYGQWADKSVYSNYMFLPKPRIAAHARYHLWDDFTKKDTIMNNKTKLNLVLQRGVCNSPPYPKNNMPFCQNWINDIDSNYNREMHKFDFVEWDEIINQTVCIEMHKKRYKRLQYCNHTWTLDDEALHPI